MRFIQSIPSRHIVNVIIIANGLVAATNIVQAQECEPVEVAKLQASDGYPWHMFGTALAVEGNIAIVGTIIDSDKGTDAGAAYIYRYDGTSWNEEAKLFAYYSEAYDWQGASVAIQGNLALVGATGDDDMGTSAGAVYVFEYDGEKWNERAKLTADDGSANDYFGYSVALDGNNAIISTNGSILSTGSAYIFQYDGINTWNQQTKLTASDGQSGDRYGCAVSISDDVAVVGAFTDDDTEIDAGSAYIYRDDGYGNWQEEAKIVAATQEYNAQFGTSVQISGNRVIIGAPNDRRNELDTGAVYVFKYAAVNWIQEDKLIDIFGMSGDDLGNSVAITDNIIIAGASGDCDNGVCSGSASMFVYDGIRWNQYAKIVPADGSENQLFRADISVSGRACLIGAVGDNELGTFAGAAYVFDINPDCTPTLTVMPDPLIGGQNATFTIKYAKPNETTYLAFSMKGTGTYYVPNLNVLLNLNQPKQAGEEVITYANGTAEWILYIPSARKGKDVWLQGCQFELKTNVLATRIE